MYQTPTSIQNVAAIENMWKNTQEVNGDLYNKFRDEVLNTPYLLEHRRHIEQNKLGFGDLPFHYMWQVLLEDVVNSFGTVHFMEIGVFKGQVLSLVPLICKHKQYPCEFLGVTPLSNAGDKFSKYPDHDYGEIITNLFKNFGVDFNIDTNIVQGFSTSPEVINQIEQQSFNLIYVDGSHEYDDVVSDIKLVDEVLEVGGYVVFDDASKFLNMPRGTFLGHIDVSQAVRDTIEHNKSYKEVLACGHNRAFRRIDK